MAYFTVPEIIDIAEGSLPFATTDTLKSKLYSPRINPKLPTIIYMELQSVKWAYGQTPSYSDIQFTANYLYDLCGIYGIRARSASGGGIPITPVAPTDDCTGMVLITEPNFESDGVTVINTDWVNKTIFIFWNNTQIYIFPPTQWKYIPGGGFEILIPGFDAHGDQSNVQMVVMVGCFNPGGTIFPAPFPINEQVHVDAGQGEFYDLEWTAAYINKYGTGSFSVQQFDGTSWNPSGIQGVPDSQTSPTYYRFQLNDLESIIELF